MSTKLTLADKLSIRKIKTPNAILYWILMRVIDILNMKVKPTFIYKAHPGEDKGPYLLISNHASRVEYQFTAPVCRPHKLNFVVGYNEFFRFPLNLILKPMQAIPKKNFTPDFYCVKQIMSVIKQGGHVCIMPEGMSSITGMAQPVMIGSGKLIKKLGVNVYYTKLSGAYLTYTKHCLDCRPGKIEVIVDQMFDSEELKNMTVEEIKDRMNKLLAHDDYIWNKEKQIRFNGKNNMAKQLDTLLYTCPKCKETYNMECGGNRMRCKSCGNEIEIDEYYNIKAVNDTSVCPPLVTDWTIMEREKAKEDVKKDNFKYSSKVKIGMLPDYKLLKHEETSKIVGEGILTLTKDGLTFDGTANNKPYNFHLTTDEVPTFGMCTDITRFYTFVNGKFVEFYPETNDVLRWDHLTEEMHRLNGGKWQNTEYRHYN